MTGTAKAIRRITAKLVALLTPPPPMNVWQWAAANLDFSRATNYDIPVHGPFDVEYMPYWKEPVECLTRHDIREITVLKATRTGGSENMLLNAIRYAVAMRPQPTLYVTGDQASAERMMGRRVKRSMKCAEATAHEYRHAQATEHDIAFPAMDLRVTWPKGKQAFKQDGWAMVLCDEVSTWPEYSADMARRRTDTYPFPHIVFISTPDPAQRRGSDDDPIFVEYRRGDQRKWMMPDPAGGGEFCWTMGKRGEAGVQWDASSRRDDGTWDYDKIEATAYYQTPGGARIEGKDRVAMTARGRWAATNPAAPSWCRSYHVTTFMVPFAAGDFGKIAVAFLKAKAQGPVALRGFIYEYLAEPWTEDVERIQDDAITRRAAEYIKGQSFFDLHADYKDVLRGKIMTVDVQKDHFWYLVRDWAAGGKSCLVEWGMAGTWDQIDEVATRHRAEVAVDAGYGERTTECYEQCIKRKFNPFKGDPVKKMPDLPWRYSDINPFEGTRRARDGASMKLVLWHTDTFKLMLLARIRGDVAGWWVYRGIERDYRLQMTAEERTPEGWVKRRRDNHLLDCEAMQIAAAAAYGYLAKWDIPAADNAEAHASATKEPIA